MIVAVIGSGTMGSGIAQVAAAAGEIVMLYDANPQALNRAKEKITVSLSALVSKAKLTQEQKDAIGNRINYVAQLQDLADAQLVVEAIVEQLDAKRQLLAKIEQIVAADTILASNTSSLSIASIASACSVPSRVIGLHFFNPAPLMQLVEVIPAVQTSAATVEKAMQTMTNWQKLPITVKDTPGFIVNRVARPFYGEALRIFDEGIANASTIDFAVKSLGGFRMGPFELMDFIGNDINYTVTETVFTAFYFDPRFKPSFTQKRLVEAGYLGKKTGRGFYDYQSNATSPINPNPKLHRKIFERILVMLINEAADALHMQIASGIAIDTAVTKGVNYPKGLLAWADELGLGWCVDQLDRLYAKYGEDRYRCCVLLRTMNDKNQTFFQ